MEAKFGWALGDVMGGLFKRACRGLALPIMAVAAICLGTTLTARTADAAAFVGATLTDVKPEDRVVVAHPQPVQLLFEFHTKGALNARATKALKATVLKTVQDSGLFSQVSEEATQNGAILNVLVEELIAPGDMAKAEGQGFVTGLTFGLKGSTVTENYGGTVDFLAGSTAPKITRTAKQFLVFQLGLIKSPPENAVKVASLNEAIYTITRQLVANPLNDIAKDPAFQGASPAPSAPNAPPLPASPQATPAPVPATPAQPVPATPSTDPTPKAP